MSQIPPIVQQLRRGPLPELVKALIPPERVPREAANYPQAPSGPRGPGEPHTPFWTTDQTAPQIFERSPMAMPPDNPFPEPGIDPRGTGTGGRPGPHPTPLPTTYGPSPTTPSFPTGIPPLPPIRDSVPPPPPTPSPTPMPQPPTVPRPDPPTTITVDPNPEYRPADLLPPAGPFPSMPDFGSEPPVPPEFGGPPRPPFTGGPAGERRIPPTEIPNVIGGTRDFPQRFPTSPPTLPNLTQQAGQR